MTDCSNCRPRLRAIEDGRIFPCPESPADYYPIGIVEECFCRHHVMWLLTWLEEFKDGKYPPQQSGYTAQPGYTAGRSQSAPHERTMQLYILLSIKLGRTGDDWQTLKDEVEADLKMEALSGAARCALNYISGPRLRQESYKHFKNRNRKGRKSLLHTRT